jgi:arylsulfatase A-like enzyme
MKINRRQLLAGAVSAPFLHIPGRAATSKPNVVFFMTDDHGAWTLGSYGCSGMHTPNLDKLASEGARFTRAFACTPVCSPSRMTYLTGVIPAIHGVQDWLQPPDSFGVASQKFLAGHLTYADLIAKAGYTLGMCGKWHMGHDDEPQCGFSYWRTVPGGGGTYKDPEFVVDGQRRKVVGYKTDIVTDFALEFLDRSKGRPFFLQVPYYAPHTPYDYQPEVYRQWYKDSDFRCFPDTPLNPRANKGQANLHGKREPKWAYSALISGVDHNVGRILQRLEEMGVRENTLVVFTADQGWNAGHHGFWGKGNGTWPLNMYEESLRVPLIWNHPGKIRAGQVLNPMVSSYDYFHSILDYLGIKAPPDPHRVGASYVPFLRGESPAWRNRLYFEYEHVRGIRTENLKFLERTKEWPNELYDLEADPGETKNVIDDPRHRKQAAALRIALDAFFKSQGAPPIDNWRSTAKQKVLTQYKSVSDK